MSALAESHTSNLWEAVQPLPRERAMRRLLSLLVIAGPAFLWLLGARIDALVSLPAAGRRATGVAGILIFGAGIFLLVWSVVTLRAATRPQDWPRKLIAVGPFAIMRHPTYFGFTLAFAGAGLAAGSFGRSLFATAVLALGWISYAIGFEEPRLRAIFGTSYEEYAASTPLLPVPAIQAAWWRGEGDGLAASCGRLLARAASAFVIVAVVVCFAVALFDGIRLSEVLRSRTVQFSDALLGLDVLCLAALAGSTLARMIQLALAGGDRQRLRLDMILTLSLCVLALGLRAFGAAPGAMPAIALLLYALGTFVLEFRPSLGLTRAQVGGMLLTGLSSALLFAL